MAKRFATGRKAINECQRSGKRVPYRDRVEDGYVPGLMVAPDWYEPPHPLDEPLLDIDDPVALYKPAPEISKPPGEGDLAPALTFEPYD
jgi:hypothetical protein